MASKPKNSGIAKELPDEAPPAIESVQANAARSAAIQAPTPASVRRTRYREKMAKAGMVQIAVFMPSSVVRALDSLVLAASRAPSDGHGRPDRASILAALIRQAKGRKR